MSMQTKKELLLHVQKRYSESNNKDKRKIIDEFISITGYQRKYAIYLLNKSYKERITVTKERKIRNKKYDDDILQALLTIWYASNQICSKRLVPFIPDLLASLEKFGHIALPIEVRNRLLTISAATIDRLLKSKRVEINKNISTTRHVSLLKKQIKIRTFADWNDVVPGFMEGDLVAHCGNSTEGQYLNTLVLTQILHQGGPNFSHLLKKVKQT